MIIITSRTPRNTGVTEHLRDHLERHAGSNSFGRKVVATITFLRFELGKISDVLTGLVVAVRRLARSWSRARARAVLPQLRHARAQPASRLWRRIGRRWRPVSAAGL
ncbi:MAG TPA: hypothetical protein VJN19_00110 [Propionibacteriaceae bacterium]|nr:hypothetical protein [Propionibacteriaceae bacterium]